MLAVLNIFDSLLSRTDTQNKKPAQYFKTLEQVVESDYPVPSYLFQRSEGWLETPQGHDDGRQGTHSVLHYQLLTPETINLASKREQSPTICPALIYHHPHGRPLKPGLAWLTRKWLDDLIQNRGPGGHNPNEDAQPGYRGFRADHEPNLARIAGSHPQNRESNNARTPTASVNYGSPGA
ncbi:hypothetical protein EI94DRAFT_1707012 [Lactarius quietus]|nr:hypothetical protein EI94DRAFT_1707012 [Lactarius quietus]